MQTKQAKAKKALHEHLTWKIVLIIALVLLAGFAVSLPFDLQISDAMYNKTHLNVSTVPHIIYAYLIILFVVLAFSICWTFVISTYSYKHTKVWVPILGTIFGWACMGGLGLYVYYFMEPFTMYFGEKAGKIHNLIWMIVIFCGSFVFAMFNFSEKFNQEMCKRTFTFLLEVVIIVALLLFLKMLWSRPTPITVFEKQTAAYPYRAWWELKPFECFKSGRKPIELWSAPAGYGTQSAVIIFATTSTLELTKRYDKHKLHTFFFFAAWTYAIVLSIARLMAGESFLSDVCLTLIAGLWISFGLKKLSIKVRTKFYGKTE